MDVPCHYVLVLELGGAVMHVLTRRRSWDEVEQTLRLGVDRPASRGDECATRVSAGVADYDMFHDMFVH